MAAKVVGLYLAAGQSKRMGQNKLALPWMGKPLGSYGLRAAIHTQLEKIIVVINPDLNNEWLEEWGNHEKVCLVICPQAIYGQASTMHCGIIEAIQQNAGGVIIQLADQPFLRTKDLDRLINRFSRAIQEKQPCDYVGYAVNHVIQPPIILGNSLFPSLLKLKGDQGARKLLKDRQHKGIRIEVADSSHFRDVDTWDAYQKLIKNE
jgi:molybdenum cofactor cytidylyltransferase